MEATVVVDEVGGVRGGDIARDRYAGGVLAGYTNWRGKFLLDRWWRCHLYCADVLGFYRSWRWARAGRWKTVDRPLRHGLAFTSRRTDSGVSAVQFFRSRCSAGRFL